MNKRETQIEQARRLIATGISEDLKEVLEQQYPELNESEDERIRKYLVEFVKLESGVNLPPDDADKILSYLEKRKEQPTNEEMLRTLRAEYEKGVADTIAKYEQKPNQSEEDKETLNRIISNYQYFCDELSFDENLTETEKVAISKIDKEDINFLKSLPERFNPLPH